jgi:hypothetical protein
MDYIKLNEKDYPFWFSMKAQREMIQAGDKYSDDVYLIWLGIKYGCLLEKKDLDLDEDKLLDIFEVDKHAFKNAYKILNDHMGELKALREIP